MPGRTIVVRVEAWDDPGGVTVREIGRLTLSQASQEGEVADFPSTRWTRGTL
jgi:hypothetical protein